MKRGARKLYSGILALAIIALLAINGWMIYDKSFKIVLMAPAYGGNVVYQCGTIDLPGVYVMNQSLINHGAYGGQACITITSGDVILDGNGSAIDGTYSETGNVCHNVYVSGTTNISIYNLNISDCVYGITFGSTNNLRINNIFFRLNPASMYFTSPSSNNTISNITSSAQNYGIYAPTGISNSIFSNITIRQPMSVMWYGMTITPSNDNQFDGISISGFSDGYGMFITGNRSIFSSLNLFSNKIGIEIQSAEGGFMFDSSVFSNWLYDIWNSANAVEMVYINVTYSKLLNDALASFIKKWYYRAYVKDTLGNPVSGANVTAYNKSGAYQFNLTTDSSGWTPITSITDYVGFWNENVYYSPYEIYASKSGYNTENSSFNASLGNNLAHSVTISFPPSVTLISPSSGTSYTGTSNVEFIFSVTGTYDIRQCLLYLDGNITPNSSRIIKSVTGSEINSIVSVLEIGQHSAYVECEDVFGNFGNSSVISLTVNPLGSNPSGGGGGTTDICYSQCWPSGKNESVCYNSTTLHRKTCGNFDADICLEWKTEKEQCQTSCADGKCTECSPEWNCYWTGCSGNLINEQRCWDSKCSMAEIVNDTESCGNCALRLVKGWNFISLCAKLSSYDIQDVLRIIDGKYQFVLEWDNSDVNNPKYIGWNSLGTKQFSSMNSEKSYFVYYTGEPTVIDFGNALYGSVNLNAQQKWDSPFYPYETDSRRISGNSFYNLNFEFIYKWSGNHFEGYSVSGTKEFSEIGFGEGMFVYSRGGVLKYVSPSRSSLTGNVIYLVESRKFPIFAAAIFAVIVFILVIKKILKRDD